MGGKQVLSERYRPVRLLGEGGSGQVWLCRDRRVGNRPVALKVLVAGSTDSGAFRGEFATLSTLIHPNLPEIHDFEQSLDGICSFSLEYIEGRAFAEALRAEGVEGFVALAAECLQAVSFIHDFGLIHRDLKPENLLVRETPKLGCRVVLLDFGLAEVRRRSGGGAGGTLRYMAPELLEGAAPSIKTDLYALGLLFGEALTGRHPVEVDPAHDLGGYLAALKRARSVETLPPGLPDGLVPWLNALSSFDPDDRPSDAREALAQLRGVAGKAVCIETEATRAARLVSGTPPGRSAEIETIRKALQTAGTTAVLLTGEAGAGKTRILDFIRADAVRQGWDIATTDEALQDADSGSRSVSEPAGVAPSRLVVIDELENASPETGVLLDHHVRRPAGSATKWIASGRAEEIRDPRVRALIADAPLLPTAEVVDLAPLNESGIAELLQRVEGTRPSDVQVRRLLETTNGLPAALETLVVKGESNGDGLARLRDSIRTRFEHLPNMAQRCLVAQAVIGEPTDSPLLCAVLAIDESDLLSTLDELSAARLIRHREQHWEVRSRFIRETILSHADAGLVTQITHGAIDLLQSESRASDPAKLARLWRSCGDLARAVEFAIRAAETARDRGRPEAAAAWFVRAIVDLPKRDPRYGALRLEHARVSEQVEDFRGAAKSYAAAVRVETHPSEKSSLLALQARSLVKSGRNEAALRIAETARDSARSLLQRCVADSVLGSVMAVRGEHERASELLLPAARQLDVMGQRRWAAEAYYSVAAAFEKGRQFESAADAHIRSERYAMAHGHVEVGVNSLISLANIRVREDDPASALERLERAQTLAADHGLSRQWIWIVSNKGRAFELLGRRDLALSHHEESGSRARLSGNRVHHAVSEVMVAENLLVLGRPAQARDRLLGLLEGPLDSKIALFVKLTLAEALLQQKDAAAVQVFSILDDLEQERKKPELAILGLITVRLEAHAHFGEPLPGDLRTRFEHCLEKEGLDKKLLARGWLAWSTDAIRSGDGHAALEACAQALEALGGRHHDLAAQVHLARSRAHETLDARLQATVALQRAREELQRAADLIEDEDLRGDFLARPVFRELRKERQTFAEAEERLGALYDMAQALNTGGDPEDQLGVILDQALRVVRAERGLILLRSEGSDQYEVRLSRNLERDTVEEAAEFSRTAVLAAGRGESVLSVHAADDDRLRQMKSISAHGIKSLLCVPLRAREARIGAVYADSRADGALFKEQDLHFLEAFADHAALALENARDMRRLEQRRERLLAATESRASFGAIVGRSKVMQAVYDMIERVAGSNLPVFIQGDSGTGKELVAREIFTRGPRRNGPFLGENCAAITESLLESELFGHVKGAFTGAEQDRTGLFEQADGGTLFLDEVGDMSPEMQARLLRVLQEGEIRRVGDETRRYVDVRVITATHRDLSELVAAGRFREDLLYRLQVLMIRVPPLRERPSDIEPLARHFLKRIAGQRGRKTIEIRTDAIELFERYAWPGNVRQLENTLQRLAVLAGGAPIARATIEQDPALAAALTGHGGRPTLSLRRNERDRIARALRESGGNRADAAKLLGVSRATIFRKIKRYGLS